MIMRVLHRPYDPADDDRDPDELDIPKECNCPLRGPPICVLSRPRACPEYREHGTCKHAPAGSLCQVQGCDDFLTKGHCDHSRLPGEPCIHARGADHDMPYDEWEKRFWEKDESRRRRLFPDPPDPIEACPALTRPGSSPAAVSGTQTTRIPSTPRLSRGRYPGCATAGFSSMGFPRSKEFTMSEQSTRILDLVLTKIRTDGGTLMRAAGVDHDVVREYAARLKEGAQFPRVVVFLDAQGVYWLASGHHRHGAHKLAGRKTILAEVRIGERRDAVLFAAGENAEHGRRRTHADKEAAIKSLLTDTEWTKWSNHEIARRCRVSPGMVRNVRSIWLLKLDSGKGKTRMARRGGSTYPVNASRIGSTGAGGRPKTAFRNLPPDQQLEQATQAETQAARDRAASIRLERIDKAIKRCRQAVYEVLPLGEEVGEALGFIRNGIAELERLKG
jgi:uncharacterized ParB-like nuclease family protein